MSRDSMQRPSTTVSFADIAHQTLIFERGESSAQLVLSLIDTPWVQRLRSVKQTGNTNLVYMFSEHSRFGHSLGVAYLAIMLMDKLEKYSPGQVRPYRDAVAAACLLHDIGHIAPGSHLAERIWTPGHHGLHEQVSVRIVENDPVIRDILARASHSLPELITGILQETDAAPQWTKAILSGGGWNADRGNWAIVDSAMCAVSYGRYNVSALIDAFRLTEEGKLVLLESRLDALTHFFVARDSMYRQVYQHRVLQAADALTANIVRRLRNLVAEHLGGDADVERAAELFEELGIFADRTMLAALTAKNYVAELSLDSIFEMTDYWWSYHLLRWCQARDGILADLACRMRDRRLFKTIRLVENGGEQTMLEKARAAASELGFDPQYYVMPIFGADQHRGKREEAPQVLLDNGDVVPVTDVEPLIATLMERSQKVRSWVAVPKEVKEKLGRSR